MFREIIQRLGQVERLDRVVNTKDIRFGAVDGPAGAPRLALRLPTDEVVTLADHALAQLAAGWGVPAPHLTRLPVELAVEELKHFSHNAPREITIRSITEPGQEHLVARAVLSGKYERFDSRDVLEAVEPYLRGFEVSSAIVERDEMRVLVTMPGHDFDVSSRRVGDVVKAGLMISNSEIGTMSLRAEFSLLRLACTNGMTAADFVHTKLRHIYVDRGEFVARLRDTVARAGQVGEQIARRLEATHALALPNLDPDEGKLQRQVVGILRRENLWTQVFAQEAEQALGSEEEASVFGLIQFLSDNARLATARLSDRVHRERVSGRLAALAA